MISLAFQSLAGMPTCRGFTSISGLDAVALRFARRLRRTGVLQTTFASHVALYLRGPSGARRVW